MTVDRANDPLIDFETRSEIDLPKCGMAKYARHKSTKVLCLGWEIDGKSGLWKPGDDFPISLAKAVRDGRPVLGWNVGFEWYMWNLVLTKVINIPPLDIDQCHDIAAWARAMGFPAALEKACDAMRLDVRKDMEGRRIMLRLCKPIPAREGSREELLGIVKYDNTPEKFNKLYGYCRSDVAAERQAALQLRPLSPFEERVWRLDFKINERGIKLDKELVKASSIMAKKAKRLINNDLKQVTNGGLRTIDQIKAMLPYVNERLVAEGFPPLEALSKETIEDYQDLFPELPSTVATVLDLRLQGAKASTAKLDAMLACEGDDGKIRGMLMYHAAGPGRWGGRLVQVQNFPRPDADIKFHDIKHIIELIMKEDIETLSLLYGAAAHFIAQSLRSTLVASEGKELVAADLNAIECRVLAWLAGESSLLNQFANNEDPYLNMAAKIPGGDRFLGKTTVLGCGYQMGYEKFVSTCKKQGRRIPLSLAATAVKAYRREHSAVTKFWQDLEDTAFKCFAYPSQWVRCGKLRMQLRDDFLWMQLPSKRLLCYPFPEIRDTERPWGEVKPSVTYETFVSQTKQWTRVPTYGGKLVENACQAVARDVMVEGMMNVERKNYETIFTVHDELITEIDKGRGNIEEFLAAMTKQPEWAQDLPIKAEGWIGDRYRKG